MATTALLGTVVMGSLLLVVLAIVLRLRHWQHPSPTNAAADGASSAANAVNGPLGWSIAFFTIAFGVTGLGMLYATGQPVAGLEPATVGLLAVGVLGLSVVLAGTVAVYGAVKTRGLNSAQAAGVSSALIATLVLLAIVAQLLIGG